MINGTEYNDSGITGKGAFKTYMELEKLNNTGKIIDSRLTVGATPGTPAATEEIGTTGKYGTPKTSVFNGTGSGFLNTTVAPIRQTKLERMGNYCEDAYDWMKQYKADCAD